RGTTRYDHAHSLLAPGARLLGPQHRPLGDPPRAASRPIQERRKDTEVAASYVLFALRVRERRYGALGFLQRTPRFLPQLLRPFDVRINPRIKPGFLCHVA